MSKLYKGLKKGLEEALAYAEGKITLKSEIIEYSISSGNVYADFGFSNPEEEKAKADLAMLITEIIKEKNLTQQQAANLMNIDQPKVSKIIRGLLSEFSIERLLKFVHALG